MALSNLFNKGSGSGKKFSASSKTYADYQNKDFSETLRNRDVYENQQLGRSKIEAKKTGTAQKVIATVLGTFAMIVMWILFSLGAFAVHSFGDFIHDPASEYTGSVSKGIVDDCYFPVDQNGNRASETCWENAASVPEPEWHKIQAAHKNEGPSTVGEFVTDYSMVKIAVSLLTGLAAGAIFWEWAKRQLEAENLERDTTDINQHENDQHVAFPEEIIAKFSPFPNAGAHSSVQASSMISHAMLKSKGGVKKVELAQRAEADIVGEDGRLEYRKGEILRNPDGSAKTKTVDMIDEEFGTALFEASGLRQKELQKRFDPTKLPYNPDGDDRDKLSGGKDDPHKFETIADLINNDWELPEYEPQRPSGMYLVDVAPVNTMVLAITRAGKGQTYIEPMLDIWMREKIPSNMVVNDPKGELLVKNYVRATLRGFQVIQFNLINPMNTDIYNPLGLASEAMREGDSAKCAAYVEAIGDVFFPTDGGDDPVWATSANNAFKRAVYGLIDFYLEEENQMRLAAARSGRSQSSLETELDAMWGKVTLYNCYQLFVQLTSKKRKSPVTEMAARIKNKEFDDLDEAGQEEFAELQVEAGAREFLWDGNEESDLLALYFNATEHLPQNSMRTLVSNANNSLKSMGGAEKMLSSVYGIAITAMSFFTDPTISRLTSGTPSQNADLGGMSFPRRFGVRFMAQFVSENHLVGTQAKWDAFEDSQFTKSLGKDFEHEDIVTDEGWARYYFKGIFPEKKGYVRLRIVNRQNGMLMRTLYFEFRKDYRKTLDGTRFMLDPVTNEHIISNGYLNEMRPVQKADASGKTVVEYVKGELKFTKERLYKDSLERLQKTEDEVPVVQATSVRYTESPKMVFLVTPPHLMKYAKLILILVKQLVDLNFDKSYMTKDSQKPLYRTRFMLDELGNLQSEGHGIANFETMLSIGLGQEQQFTLILQTLQQLKDVYGDSVDKIVQGNVSNTVFLKSTDDSMIDTLVKMTGVRHVVRRNSKSVRKDVKKMAFKTEGDVSYTYAVEEEPLISFGDFMFMPERNSVVIRAGDPPVWNRNEMILPMSFKLFDNTIENPGKKYSLQTVPTLSSAMDFNVKLNQPNFVDMLEKRMRQAMLVEKARSDYQEAYGLSDFEMTRLDQDVFSAEIMDLVNNQIMATDAAKAAEEDYDVDSETEVSLFDMNDRSKLIDNDQFIQDTAETQRLKDWADKPRYAGGQIAISNLVSRTNPLIELHQGTVNHGLDVKISRAYDRCKRQMLNDPDNFKAVGEDLYSEDGLTPYIQVDRSKMREALNDAQEDPESNVYGEEKVQAADVGTYVVSDAFYLFLARQNSWLDFADGKFDAAMQNVMTE